MLALEQQGLTKSALRKDVYVAYAENKETEAIKKATGLRSRGLLTALAPQAQTKEDAEAYCKNKGCKELVYIK